jgi:septum formation inhibitor MinC
MNANESVAVCGYELTFDSERMLIILTDNDLKLSELTAEVQSTFESHPELTEVALDVEASGIGLDALRNLVERLEAVVPGTIKDLTAPPELLSGLILEAISKPASDQAATAQPAQNREVGEDWRPTGPIVPDRMRNGRRTTQVHGTVRSGRIVRFDGDVVLIGDINPGAKVIATGDVFILGRIKGSVYAGSEGDNNAFIFSLGHSSPQLRVGGIVHFSGEGESSETPTLAYLKHEQLQLIPFTGKVPR